MVDQLKLKCIDGAPVIFILNNNWSTNEHMIAGGPWLMLN